MRALIENVSQIPDGTKTVIELCKENIAWAEAEKRTPLRLHLQNTLAEAYYKVAEYNEALNGIKALLREVKKSDDKLFLVSIFLLESRVQHALQHLPRARVSFIHYNLLFCLRI